VEINACPNGIVPIVALDFTLGTGLTESDPYLINNIGQLSYMREKLKTEPNAFYKLNQTIDVSTLNCFTWEPIGKVNPSSETFKGTFLGNKSSGYSIKGLTVKEPSQTYVGMFGYVNSATFKDIDLVDVDILGYSEVGGLVGRDYGSTIQDVTVTGSVNGYSYIGGVAGRDTGGGATYTRVSFSGNVSGEVGIGGILADANGGPILISFSKVLPGSLIKGTTNVGGMVGSVNSGLTLKYSTSAADVTGNLQTGGLVGYLGSLSEISGSYSTGTVTGGDKTGGLVGNITSALVCFQLFPHIGELANIID